MKLIKRVAQVVACGMCLVAVAPSAIAEAQRGFYLGISGGKSTYDVDKAEFDSIALDAFFSQGAPVLSRSSKLEDSDTALAIFGGYRFFPYLALEAGYLDLGKAEYRFSGLVNPPGPVTSAPAALSFGVESKGFTIAGIGSIPIGSVVDLHGRLGLFIAQTELVAIATSNNSSGRDSETLNSVSALYGVGAGFHLGQHWSLSVDWTRHANVGDENEDDDYSTAEGIDIDALTFSASFKF